MRKFYNKIRRITRFFICEHTYKGNKPLATKMKQYKFEQSSSSGSVAEWSKALV